MANKCDGGMLVNEGQIVGLLALFVGRKTAKMSLPMSIVGRWN